MGSPSMEQRGPGGVPIRAPAALIGSASGVRATALGPDGSVAAPIGPDEVMIGVLPPLYPEWLGDRSFLEAHGCRFPYVVGEMARGIASAEMVVASARAGLMTFFGSAGLSIPVIDEAVREIQAALGPEGRNWGANLIHSPNESHMELDFARLMLERDVRNISASAFMRLSPAVVLLSAKGLTRAPDGSVRRRTHIFAKVSRVEVARPFLSPAPEAMLRPLVASGALTEVEAELARLVPIAEDLTVEADSGGHTDNRPLPVLLPLMIALAQDVAAEHGYARAPRVGVGGWARKPWRDRGRVRGWRGVRRHGVGEPGDDRVRPVTGRPSVALGRVDHGRRDGSGRRHVRAGCRSAGAQEGDAFRSTG